MAGLSVLHRGLWRHRRSLGGQAHPSVSAAAPPGPPPIRPGSRAGRGACACRASTGRDTSAFDRLRGGTAHRIALPGQVFSRVHVDDIASGVIAALEGAAGSVQSRRRSAVQPERCDRGSGPVAAPAPAAKHGRSGPQPRRTRILRRDRRVANSKGPAHAGWRPIHPTYREGRPVPDALVDRSMHGI